ncbi:type II secretion system protein [Alicyclobacillus acidiphilus]|uniref:type II secretion system protein n=1 Tax=Alicyclobacillus acidiphilus TaxID=182455 RepID=UPI00082DD560|nr:prepilin-type N-terminal cleavage/methylation domain-containing protein [Alicyclobacillus acidiphilus]
MGSEKRVTNESGVTLIELLAAIVISGMIAGILVTILWSSALRASRLTGYNVAQRNVVEINHMLTDELHKASFVQVDQTSATNTELWLYSGGTYYPGSSTTSSTNDSEWLYNTSTVASSSSNASSNVSLNSTQAELVNATPFAELIFTQGQTGSWTITLYNAPNAKIGNPQVGCPSSPLGVEQWSSSDTTNQLGVEFEFPSGSTSPTLANINCRFVNSFVIRLSETYQSSTGQQATYYLTAGYHDGLLR